MAWYSDEQYDMIQDSREKKSIAASAHKQRTHCGKGGTVRFPSDYLSAKELRAMNGECIKYASLKKPMTWDEFKILPDDLKTRYVKSLREKFNVPDSELAKMFGTDKNVVYRHFKCYGLCKGVGSGAKVKTWNQDGWLLWLHGEDPNAVRPSETPVEEGTDVGSETPVEEVTDVGSETPVEEVTDEVVENTLVAVNENPDIIVIEGPVVTADEAAVEEILAMAKDGVEKVEAKSPEKKGTDVQKHVDNFFRNEAVKEGYLLTECEEICTNPYHYIPVIPKKGSMSFEYNDADDALATIKALLSNAKINLTISWECV